MATITQATRPDPNYYVHIVQNDDLTWTADEMPVDDTMVAPPSFGQSQAMRPIPGLRTLTSYGVIDYATNLIAKYAPPDLQRNFLYTLSTTTTGTAHDNAKAAMDWVASVNTYRDNEVANVKTLNYAQLKTYAVPAGTPPWPTPPASLPPVSPVSSTSMSTVMTRK
jgi:hypothetical protein